MRNLFTRRTVLTLALAGGLGLVAGCQNNEIPLVEFPEGMAPPPSSGPVNPGGPQGDATSQGDPTQYSQ